MLHKINMVEFGKYMAERPNIEEANLKVSYLSSISKIREQNIYDPLHLITGDSTLQILCGLYASNNDNKLQMKYIFPHKFNSINLMSESFVRGLPVIFKNIQIVYNDKSKNIYEIRFKDMNQNFSLSYFNLIKQKKIDPYLTILLKANKIQDRSFQLPVYYEFHENKNLKNINLESIPITAFLIFLISQCRNRHINRVIIPFRGWIKDDIEKCEILKKLNNYFNRVLFVGEGDPWISTEIMFIEPIQAILDFMDGEFFKRGAK